MHVGELLPRGDVVQHRTDERGAVSGKEELRETVGEALTAQITPAQGRLQRRRPALDLRDRLDLEFGVGLLDIEGRHDGAEVVDVGAHRHDRSHRDLGGLDLLGAQRAWRHAGLVIRGLGDTVVGETGVVANRHSEALAHSPSSMDQATASSRRKYRSVTASVMRKHDDSSISSSSGNWSIS